MQRSSLCMRTKLLLFITAVLSLTAASTSAYGHGEATKKTGAYDVFVPISKYICAGEAENLSAWFADNMEVSILSNSSHASRSQARQIVKSFFDSYTPHSFEILHTAGRGKMKYALGALNAGGEKFLVTLFVGFKNDSFHILQFKIQRMQ